ncbi:hypothetical protein [Burkholderia cenocepacia]|uniref:hypothetical protein n=1 Tax=Burkholderia cenocepacia TaxID=95486 RepID=UPI0028B98BF9|nr:hypothetical protein [Burkholderia cenocepacia]MDT6995512.1 hypothetical protein [Burkholderia cenocepacia]
MLELSRSTFRTLIHYIENPEADKLSSKSHIPAGVPAPIRPSYERERTSTFKFADDQPRLPDRENERGIRRMARHDARRSEAKQREPILLPFSRDVLVLDPNIAPLKRPRIVIMHMHDHLRRIEPPRYLTKIVIHAFHTLEHLGMQYCVLKRYRRTGRRPFEMNVQEARQVRSIGEADRTCSISDRKTFAP